MLSARRATRKLSFPIFPCRSPVTTCRAIALLVESVRLPANLPPIASQRYHQPSSCEFAKIGWICQTRYSFPAPATICITTNSAMTHQYLLRLLAFWNPTCRLNLLLQERFLILLFCLWHFPVRVQNNRFVKDRLGSGTGRNHFHLQLILPLALPL